MFRKFLAVIAVCLACGVAVCGVVLLVGWVSLQVVLPVLRVMSLLT